MQLELEKASKVITIRALEVFLDKILLGKIIKTKRKKEEHYVSYY
jgi:hypothetical protein